MASFSTKMIPFDVPLNVKTAAATALAGVVLVLLGKLVSRSLSRRPPGPPGKLLSGNAHQLPATTKEKWETYMRWAEEYGSPVIYYRVHSKQFVVINNVKAAFDLMEGRSNIYSDRPMAWFFMAPQLGNRGMSPTNISSQNPLHKTYRRMLGHGLNQRAVKNYSPIMRDELKTLVSNINATPENFIAHIRRMSNATALKLAYGWPMKDDNDILIEMIKEAFYLAGIALQPGRWAVDSWPFLRFVPDWFPFTGWKKTAQRVAQRSKEIDIIPFNWAKEQIAKGDHVESFASHFLQPEDKHTVDPKEEALIQTCCTSFFAGGSDTTVSSMSSCVLFLVRFPDVQRRFQVDIDSFVAENNRLPTTTDRDEPRFAYVRAVISEVERYAPVAPIGPAHRLTTDDYYEGYLIPKGTTIVPNIWAMTRDPAVYSDPNRFDPERFLPPRNELDPKKIVFGFGRRICPGAYFAETTLFFHLTNLLAIYDLKPGTDEAGRTVDLNQIQYKTGLTSHPEPFKCDFVCRNPELMARLSEE
ncbi:cytochrome P450 [Schizophyllum amplum]|uniref:Cytochrome P450 n=1 Tax=Schizophyllum amplum TaxID=97359 RepID=A0A550CU44_9AGAR|nr:cytochrome P450 [Auriculariopsis ampla]